MLTIACNRCSPIGFFAMNSNRLMRQNKLPCQQKGMTLIEIMIALLLGVFLLAGVMQIFISSRETYRVQEALSRLQENGRFAMDFIGRDIRMADYRACPTKPFLTDPVTFDRTGIMGTNGAVNAANSALDAPDSITVRWSAVACLPASNASVTHGYTIAVPASGISELQRDGNSLIEGVENMQITYGVDTDNNGTPNYYGQAGAVTNADMGNVVSVRVSLLLYTIDNNVTPTPLAYTYNAATSTPALPDRRIRRVFNSTFTLRNRVH
jgi:type IV pilus assembly protein PilW